MPAELEKVQLGAIGVNIKVTVKEDNAAVNISTVTTKQIMWKKPDGSALVTKTASFFTDGTDGILVYTTVSGDIDVLGVWEVQGYVVFPAGFDGRSEKTQFRVLPNLS